MPARGQRVLEAGNSLPASGHYGAYQDSIWRPWRECRGGPVLKQRNSMKAIITRSGRARKEHPANGAVGVSVGQTDPMLRMLSE